jgi:hypothetical protein
MKRYFPILFVFVFPLVVRAGPPFVTDDPEPVDYRHWEVYLASQLNQNADGWTGTAPHIEINYGAIPNLQLHLIMPDAFSAPISGPKEIGYGDTELGAKYRFIEQGKYTPEVATFPLVELPTGSYSRGLGSGHTQVYLPIWMQKDFGKWTVYGGGGYWINPGPNNQNWGFVGCLVQWQLTSHFALGTEIFHQTAQHIDAESSTNINVGGTLDLNDLQHVLFSVGHTVQGQSGYQGYIAIQFTFGPEERK